MVWLMVWYVFCLGLAVGLTLLMMTAYLRVSPRWLSRLLLVSGVFVASRYVAMVVFAFNQAPQPLWLWSRCWFATAVGLTFPGAVALDQLVRHPAMTPKKLLRWCAPFLVAYMAALVGGRMALVPDPFFGVRPHLIGWARPLLAMTQSAFVLLFLWIGAQLLRKVPASSVRFAVALLMLSYGTLALCHGVSARQAQLFLFPEMLTMLALWCAFDIAQRQTS